MVEISKQAHITELRDEETDSGSPTAQMKPLEIPNALSVRQLADLLKVSSIAVIKQLVRNGIMANINQVIEYEAAAAVIVVFGIALPTDTDIGSRGQRLFPLIGGFRRNH